MKVLTVATRPGQLAIAQTRTVISALEQEYPDIQIKIRKVTSRGDRDRRTALWNLKSTGFFTSQVENALLAGEADFAVHSFKDLPTAQREGLTIGAVFDRNFVEDCLVSASPVESIEQLLEGAKVGTSSLRRAAQLKHLRADLQPTPIRGNVQTRLNKLDSAEFDAVVLARAGLERLGLGERISLVFDPSQFIPAPAQGALAIQTRSDDKELRTQVSVIDDINARRITSAERQVLTTMQCGCHAPVGAFAKIVGGDIEICAFISDLQGKNFIRRRLSGPAENAGQLAEQIANELLDVGGEKILACLEQ
ncbi:MAG: hydroxymethylbilane synthase [Planctomycetota bacterium]|jgi:hydroxymethylbilane synthase